MICNDFDIQKIWEGINRIVSNKLMKFLYDIPIVSSRLVRYLQLSLCLSHISKPVPHPWPPPGRKRIHMWGFRIWAFRFHLLSRTGLRMGRQTLDRNCRRRFYRLTAPTVRITTRITGRIVQPFRKRFTSCTRIAFVFRRASPGLNSLTAYPSSRPSAVMALEICQMCNLLSLPGAARNALFQIQMQILCRCFVSDPHIQKWTT